MNISRMNQELAYDDCRSFDHALEDLGSSGFISESAAMAALITKDEPFFRNIIDRFEPIEDGQEFRINDNRPKFAEEDDRLSPGPLEEIHAEVVDATTEEKIASVALIFVLPANSRFWLRRKWHEHVHKDRATVSFSILPAFRDPSKID